MKIKNLTKEDTNYINEIINIYHSWWSKNNSEEEIRLQLFSDNTLVTRVLTDDNDNLIGVCELLKDDNVSIENYTPYLADLYVKEDYRGMGYSKILIEDIINEVKKLGLKKLYLHSRHVGFYEKYGFKLIKEVNGKRIFEIEL